MDEKLITIKEASLNNNCPECFNTNGLQLTFKQKFVETSLYKSITSETTQSIYCNTCNTDIFPVMWTEDIERVFAYHQKAFVPKKKSTKLKRKAWLLIGSFVIVILAVIIAAVLYR
ncbi:hypothetical protein [Oceanihabitans sediminis]|uniref:Uncharacterized protein n=1 Tax=Oceanihabitans sediminis TaxID=1812012 RepID=A0A368P849_9FLAO|nr:hypothetical protein [Oceanihabitans sediminis]MDX1277585.1 hypothetical protein [Oceanihabitans sediminis]MDX1773240.1 hypothetical protein [Oceanihabitans sediminis]RBP34933.1 hypothetical protein DFR65_101833 [Oceanihabitans sediminis]RCU58573.1 hypothetical protein DU428_04125 [Oceanihabitans sediminis]